MSCPIPILTERVKADLQRMQDGANAHDVNNRRHVIRVIEILCNVQRTEGLCPGPLKCAYMAENTETVVQVNDWVVERYRLTFKTR